MNCCCRIVNANFKRLCSEGQISQACALGPQPAGAHLYPAPVCEVGGGPQEEIVGSPPCPQDTMTMMCACPCQSYTTKAGYRWLKIAHLSNSVRTKHGDSNTMYRSLATYRSFAPFRLHVTMPASRDHLLRDAKVVKLPSLAYDRTVQDWCHKSCMEAGKGI